MIPTSQRRPLPISLAAHIDDRKKLRKVKGGGFEFEGVAQVYGAVNDRGMKFLPGSATKTIQERVANGSVAITDGHPQNAEVSSTLGFVKSAKDTEGGIPYVGFLSATEEVIADKITDGTIKQNSVRMQPLRVVALHVPLNEVPEQIRKFQPIDKDGLAIVAGIQQWRWIDLGLVSNSAQDVRAIFEPPTLVPFQGLAASQDGWTAAEGESKLKEWSKIPACQAAAHLAQFYAPDGEIVLAGQIAAPDDEGRLIVSISALPVALDELLAALAVSSLSEDAQHATFTAAYRHVRRYETPLTESSQSATLKPTAATDAASQESAGPVQQPPTVGSEDASHQLAMLTQLDAMARIRELQRRLTEGPVHEPAGHRRGLSTAERPGSR